MLTYKNFMMFGFVIGFSIFFVTLMSIGGAFTCYHIAQTYSDLVATPLLLLTFLIIGLIVGSYMWLIYKILIKD